MKTLAYTDSFTRLQVCKPPWLSERLALRPILEKLLCQRHVHITVGQLGEGYQELQSHQTLSAYFI